jgi:hypothetical protein
MQKKQTKTAAKIQSKTATKQKKKTVAKAVNPADTGTPPPVGDVQARIALILSLIDQIQALIPGFGPPNPATAAKVAIAARYAKELVPALIDIVSSYPLAANVFDVEAGNNAMENDKTMGPVIDRLGALFYGTAFTVNSQSATAGLQALAAYSWAKSHANSPVGAGIKPYLPKARRAVQRVNNHRKVTPKVPPAPKAPSLPSGANTFLAPNLGSRKKEDADIGEQFDRALDEAAKD